MKKLFLLLVTIVLMAFFVTTAVAAEPVAPPTVSEATLIIQRYDDMDTNGVRDTSEALLFEMTTVLNDFPTGNWALKVLPGEASQFATGCTVDGIKQDSRNTAEILLNGTTGEKYTISFGNAWKYSIFSGAFSDTNKDGQWDADEPGIADVSISLKGKNLFGENVKIEMLTDLTGNITMKDLLPGKYNLAIEDPNNMTIFNSLEIEPKSGENTGIFFGFGPYTY